MADICVPSQALSSVEDRRLHALHGFNPATITSHPSRDRHGHPAWPEPMHHFVSSSDLEHVIHANLVALLTVVSKSMVASC